MIHPRLPTGLGQKLAFATATTAASLLLIELLFRAACVLTPATGDAIDQYRMVWLPESGFDLSLRPHPYFGYVNGPDDDVNQYGFNYDGDIAFEKPRNGLRVLCYGGSTTAGPDSWPQKLEVELQKVFPTRQVEVLNLGISGWTTAESLVAHTLLGQSYAHDLLILHNVNNDIDPQRHEEFEPDYSHFRRAFQAVQLADGTWDVPLSWAARLDRFGSTWSNVYVYTRMWTVGPPDAAYSVAALTQNDSAQVNDLSKAVEQERAQIYLRNLRTMGMLTEAQGGKVMVATMPSRTSRGQGDAPIGWITLLADQNTRMTKLAQTRGWGIAPLHTQMTDMDDHFEDYIHVDQVGEQRKAELVARAIAQAKLLR